MKHQTLIRSQPAPSSATAVLLDITPATAGWDLVHFIVRRLGAGEKLPLRTEGEECAIVLLSGSVEVTIDGGAPQKPGPRKSVFDSYPHAVYLSHGHAAVLQASEPAEIAECRAPSSAALEPRLITPADCGYEIREVGNATRQILDNLPPPTPPDNM